MNMENGAIGMNKITNLLNNYPHYNQVKFALYCLKQLNDKESIDLVIRWQFGKIENKDIIKMKVKGNSLYTCCILLNNRTIEYIQKLLGQLIFEYNHEPEHYYNILKNYV